MPDLREKIFENLRQKNVFSDLPEANPAILTAKIEKILEESCSAIPELRKLLFGSFVAQIFCY